MKFLNPVALWLLLLVPVIILLHLVVRKRKTITVSATFLWREVLAEQRKSIRLRNLVYNANLLLQILTAVVLSLAIARPAATWLTGGGTDVIIVFDRTASMSADDGKGPRIDLAKSAVLDLLEKLHPSSRAMLIGASSRTEILSNFTDGIEYTADMVASIGADETAGNPSQAIFFAMGTMRSISGEGTANPQQLIVVTDGAFDPDPALDFDQVNAATIIVGEPSNNTGFTSFRLRRTPDDSAYEILTQIKNYGTATQNTTVTVSVDGSPVENIDVLLGPGETQSHILRYEGLAAREAMGELAISDALAVDNRVYSVLNTAPSIKVLSAGPNNFFLERALETYPSIDLTRVPELSGFGGGFDGYDVVILDRTSSPPLPGGAYLFIDTIPQELQTSAVGTVSYPVMRSWAPDHPVMKGVNLGGTTVAVGTALAGGAGVQELAGSSEGPLILSYIEPDYRYVYLGFDILLTDLPLRPAFPILIGNAVTWLYRGNLPEPKEGVSAGAPIPVEGSVTGLGSAQIERPDGTIDIPQDPERYLGTDTTGIYTVTDRYGERFVAVNMTDPAESNITPRFSLGTDPADESFASEGAERALWTLFLICAAAVLTFEWFLWWKRW